MGDTNISAQQYFSMLYLSVLSTVFMYISSPDVPVANGETLLHPFVFLVVSIFAGVPAFLVYRFVSKMRMNNFAVNDKKMFFKVVSLLYAVIYLLCALKSIMRFDLFASSELFPGKDMTLFLFALIVVCGAIAYTGLGALCRGSLIFCFIVVCATIFVAVSLADEVTVLNFTPLTFEGGVGKFISDSLLFSIQATEIGTLTLFLPSISGDLKKHYLRWAIFSAVSFFAVLFFVIGSLGYFANTQLFPTYTAVTIANFGLLERIDALETSIWILCVVVKISLYINICMRCALKTFKKATPKFAAISLVVVLGGIPALLSSDIRQFSFISNDILSAFLYLGAVIILPLAILIYLKKVNPYEKINEDI